jgi:hypothetical protein
MSDTAAETGPKPIRGDKFVETVIIVIAIIAGIMGANHLSKVAKSLKTDGDECGSALKPCYVKIMTY